MPDKTQTAVDWFYEKIKRHFEHNGELLETLTFTMELAKQKEREQHGRTWDAAIEAHKIGDVSGSSAVNRCNECSKELEGGRVFCSVDCRQHYYR